MSQRSRASWSSWRRRATERRLTRVLDHLELLEQRAAQLETRLRVWDLTAQEVERLLAPLLEVPSTPAPPPPLLEPLSPVRVSPQPGTGPAPALPVVHRPEVLTEEPPPPPAEDQLRDLLSQSTPSSPSLAG